VGLGLLARSQALFVGATMNNAKKFLATLFAKVNERICVVSYANADKTKFPPRELYSLDGGAILKFIKDNDKPGRAVYTCVSTMPKGKRTKANAHLTVAAFADLDFKGIAVSRLDIEAVLARLPLRPTFIIFTGNGLHVWWLFDEPSSEHERVEALLKKIAWVLSGDPAVCEISRVMRVPDTHNSKNGKNDLVTIVQHNDARVLYRATRRVGQQR
jgi:hypothetical protein